MKLRKINNLSTKTLYKSNVIKKLLRESLSARSIQIIYRTNRFGSLNSIEMALLKDSTDDWLKEKGLEEELIDETYPSDLKEVIEELVCEQTYEALKENEAHIENK